MFTAVLTGVAAESGEAVTTLVPTVTVIVTSSHCTGDEVSHTSRVNESSPEKPGSGV